MNCAAFRLQGERGWRAETSQEKVGTISMFNTAGYGQGVLIGGQRDASVPANEWREASLNDTSAEQLPQGKGFTALSPVSFRESRNRTSVRAQVR